MTYEKVQELIKILETENEDDKISNDEKNFNIEWISLLRKSIKTAFEKKWIRQEKRHRKLLS